MEIIKRDGAKVQFDKTKIINAINKAFIDVDGDIYETDTATSIAFDIEQDLKRSPELASVESIQNLVEKYLMESDRKDVARSYIRYRYKKEVARDKMDDFISTIREKLDGNNVQNQNANVDEHSFGGRMGEAGSAVSKQFALDFIVSEMARNNHLNNRIYIHDLDNYYVGSHNCLSLPLDDLLAQGFSTRQTDIRPAGSVSTAFQLVAVLFQLQSLQQFGGVSATHLDWTMVPYVRKSFRKHYINGLKYIENIDDQKLYDHIPEDAGINDEEYKIYQNAYKYAMDMTEKEIHQAVEGMYHNLSNWVA